MRVSHFIVGTKSHILDHLTDSTEVKLHDVDPWRQKTYQQYTPLWEIDEENFPGGFAELSAALERINSGLGLWFGPIGGYGEGLRLRGERGREISLEVTHKGYLNHAGSKYGKIFKEKLLEYMERYDDNYYKLDGLDET